MSATSTHRPRIIAALVTGILVLAGAGGCRPGEPDGPAGAAERTPPQADPVDEGLWLGAGCDLQRRLDEQIGALEARGVVPVHGGEAYRWAFECDGAVLRATVQTVGATADGDPILWLGAAGDPPRLVPIRLDAGSGQGDLERLLSDPGRPEPQVIAVDPATGVVWRI